MNPQTYKTFWEQVDKSEGETACWPWLGGVSSNGYGKARFNGLPTRLAHVIAFRLFNRTEQKGLILHTCHNKLCCNPTHLMLGDHSLNARQSISVGVWTTPSKVRGVFRYRNGWRAAATLKGVWFLLYQGEDFFDACCARKSWEARNPI